MALNLVLLGIGLPALAAGAILALSLAGRERRAASPAPRVGPGPLALGAGYLAGHWGILGRPSFPPAEAAGWLFWAALGAAAAGLLEAGLFRRAGPLPGGLRWPVRVAVAAAPPWLFLWPVISFGPGAAGGAGWWWPPVLGAAALLWWTLLDTLAERRPGPTVPLALWISASATAATVLLSGSASLGQLGGALAAALAAFAAAAWRWPGLTLACGALAPVTTVLAGLWTQGCFYSELTAANAVLLSASPLAAFLGEWRAVRRLGPFKAAALALAASLLPAALAVAIAWRSSPALEPAG